MQVGALDGGRGINNDKAAAVEGHPHRRLQSFGTTPVHSFSTFVLLFSSHFTV
jgi:hypothetical protein